MLDQRAEQLSTHDLRDILDVAPVALPAGIAGVTVQNGWLDQWREWHGWDTTSQGNVFLRALPGDC